MIMVTSDYKGDALLLRVGLSGNATFLEDDAMNMKTAALVCACLLLVCGGRVSGQVQPAPGESSFPALRFIRWVEPKEHSFSVEVPQGWAVDGGVNWLSQIDPQGFIRLRSPDGKINVFMGDPELLSREVPTPAGRAQTGVNEGQIFRTPSGGPALLGRYMTGQEYAKQHVTWRLCREPAWVTGQDLPDVSQAMAAAIAPEARKYNVVAIANAGEVTYTCGVMQGATFATTVIVGEGGPIQIWGVYRVAGFQSADPLHSMEARYIMEHLLASFANDPAWTETLDRRTMQLTGSVMSMQNAATQAQLAASRQQNETLSRLNHPNAGVPSRSTSGTGGSSSRRDVNSTLGTAHVCDAIGRCANVSNTSDSYYMDHSGNVRQGSAGGGAPDNTGVWSRLY
jgi:hypothetical protein